MSLTKGNVSCSGSSDILSDNIQTPITTVKPKPLALRQLKQYNKPGRLECEVLGNRNDQK